MNYEFFMRIKGEATPENILRLHEIIARAGYDEPSDVYCFRSDIRVRKNITYKNEMFYDNPKASVNLGKEISFSEGEYIINYFGKDWTTKDLLDDLLKIDDITKEEREILEKLEIVPIPESLDIESFERYFQDVGDSSSIIPDNLTEEREQDIDKEIKMLDLKNEELSEKANDNSWNNAIEEVMETIEAPEPDFYMEM